MGVNSNGVSLGPIVAIYFVLAGISLLCHHSTIFQMKPTVPAKIAASAFHIHPLFIDTKVLDPSGRSNITIAFTSERKPTEEWLFLKETGQMYRTGTVIFFARVLLSRMGKFTDVGKIRRHWRIYNVTNMSN